MSWINEFVQAHASITFGLAQAANGLTFRNKFIGAHVYAPVTPAVADVALPIATAVNPVAPVKMLR